MIGWFPDPYPDELLYSVAARYAERVGYPNCTAAIEELFGQGSTRVSIDFPLGLDYLLNTLPPAHRFSFGEILHEQTLFPFYGPFLPIERGYRLMQAMREKRGKGLHRLISGTIGTIRPPEWLRFCPECAQDDFKTVGEPYWHRLPQLPGAIVCPRHHVFLENSAVRYANRRPLDELIPASQAIPTLTPKPIEVGEKAHALLLQLATNFAWLLTQPYWYFDLPTLKQRYLILLHTKDLATYGGHLHARLLREQFLNFFSPTLLNQLQCALPSSQENWLTLLVRVPNKAHHPLKHLLLMQFLAESPQQFFAHPWLPRPFGVGPYPCLNNWDDHYRERRIINYEVACHRTSNQILGTFRCQCGFVYSRRGPDQKAEDQFTFTRIIAMGAVWDNRLVRLWNDPKLSLQSIGDHLNVSRKEVKRHATRLGLDFQRRGLCLVFPHQHMQYLSATEKPGFDYKRQQVRQTWLHIRATQPDLQRKILRQRFPKPYNWLWTYDRKWMETNLPPRFCTPHKGSPGQTDWEGRDAYLVRQAKAAAERLLYLSKAPIRLTFTSIGREMGKLSLIYDNRHRLPQTVQTIAGLTETSEAFCIRRIWGKVQNLPTSHPRMTFAQFVQYTGLSAQVTHRIPIQAVLKGAYESILEGEYD
ncbi:MAG: TniQ family protein [Nitrospira sp.]|nr:TniQ family protein [Nitrospira sp.]